MILVVQDTDVELQCNECGGVGICPGRDSERFGCLDSLAALVLPLPARCAQFSQPSPRDHQPLDGIGWRHLLTDETAVLVGDLVGSPYTVITQHRKISGEFLKLIPAHDSVRFRAACHEPDFSKFAFCSPSVQAAAAARRRLPGWRQAQPESLTIGRTERRS